MIAIVTGMIATYPVGGVAWDYGQYALGLENLGIDVYYLEDTGNPTYDPVGYEYSDDYSYGVRFLEESLTALSPTLGQRWHYRAPDDSTAGMAPQEFQKLLEKADFFLNVSGGTLLRDEYMACPHKILIDSDPGLNHFVNYPGWDAEPGWQGTHGFRGHDHFFTYAERIGAADCVLPDLGIAWHPTRPPVIMDKWHATSPGDNWTSVMTWNHLRKPVQYKGTTYGSKEMEFPKIETLPQRLPNTRFEQAIGGSSAAMNHLSALGWQVVDSHLVSRTMNEYRDYIEGSRGELSVAKNLYTATRSGWFSCRSVCYLAAGLPCVLQDTGFSEFIPTGEGLMAWDTLDDAERSIREVESRYQFHQRRAREIAGEYFAADRVLLDLLLKAGLPV
ncbi:MAG: hypothetical protein ACTHK7_16420 [Aureliella sp.]